MLNSMETYYGQVRSPQDAIILFEACRIGILPRVQRRLSEKERQSIRSGSVFVWDEREAGMRRWTDGKSWSASRVSGSFLTYREMEGKRGGFNPHVPNGKKLPGINDKNMERTSETEPRESPDEGDGPDGYRYKPDGLMKQSFSITTQDGRHLHLISYYSRTNSNSILQQPSADPQLRTIRPQKGMYPEANLESNAIPAVTRGPLGANGPWPPTAGQPPHAAAYNPYPVPPPQHYPYPPPHGHHPGYPPHMAPPPWAAGAPPGYAHHYYPPGPFHYPPQPHPQYPPAPNHGHPAHSGPPPHSHMASTAQSPSGPAGGYPTPPSTTLPPLLNAHNSPSGPPPLRSPTTLGPQGNSRPYSSGNESPRSSSAPTDPALSAPNNGHATNGTASVPPRRYTPESSAEPKPNTYSAASAPSLPRTTSSNSTPPRVTDNRTIPSITSLLGPTHGQPTNGARTPPGGLPSHIGVREIADPVSGLGRERDKSDLKRLDSHSLKFN